MKTLRNIILNILVLAVVLSINNNIVQTKANTSIQSQGKLVYGDTVVIDTVDIQSLQDQLDSLSITPCFIDTNNLIHTLYVLNNESTSWKFTEKYTVEEDCILHIRSSGYNWSDTKVIIDGIEFDQLYNNNGQVIVHSDFIPLKKGTVVQAAAKMETLSYNGYTGSGGIKLNFYGLK